MGLLRHRRRHSSYPTLPTLAAFILLLSSSAISLQQFGQCFTITSFLPPPAPPPPPFHDLSSQSKAKDHRKEDGCHCCKEFACANTVLSSLSTVSCQAESVRIFADSSAGGGAAARQGIIDDRTKMEMEILGGSGPRTDQSRPSLRGFGSSPPTCQSKCGRCFPCRPVHVPIQRGVSMPLEYYPEAWRCQCGSKLFMP